jgi:ABC-type spermidine/putrescine transport system permease subunit II
MRRLRAALALIALALYAWPLALAVWISFSDSTILAIPSGYSLRWYAQLASSAQWRLATQNSLIVACMAALIATGAGLGLANHVRAMSARAAQMAELLILSPMCIPPVVLAMALLPMARWSGLYGTHLALALAHATWSLPLPYLLCKAALDGIDPQLIEAARGLGATPAQRWRRVILPLTAPSVGIGLALTFVLSFNEFIIALFIATPRTETLPRVIWPNLRYTLTPIISAASGVSMLLALAAMTLVVAWTRRGAKDR